MTYYGKSRKAFGRDYHRTHESPAKPLGGINDVSMKTCPSLQHTPQGGTKKALVKRVLERAPDKRVLKRIPHIGLDKSPTYRS